MLNRPHFYLTFLSLAAAFAAISCTPDNPPPPKSELNLSAVLPGGIKTVQPGDRSVVMSSPNIQLPRDPFSSPPPTPSRSGTVIAAPAKTPLSKEEIVIPPKDAKWTIFCTVIGGQGHVTRAKELKQSLAAATRSSKWYVVHDDEKSTIYYGFYRSIDRSTREGAAAQDDKRALANFKDVTGDSPLQLCAFLPIDKPAPEAPLEWDLGRVGQSPEHYWSLQIAAYTADATDPDGHDRKWAAVESVKELRAQGVPAFYYHGDAISSVCVGAWPENAVKHQTAGNEKGNAGTVGASEKLFVLASPLPAGMRPIDPEGGELHVVAPRVEIVDQSMYDMIKKFPIHYINSEERQHRIKNPQTGIVEMVSAPTFLVFVPELKQGAAPINGRQVVTDPNTQSLPASLLGIEPSRTAPQPGVGRLRSVGE